MNDVDQLKDTKVKGKVTKVLSLNGIFQKSIISFCANLILKSKTFWIFIILLFCAALTPLVLKEVTQTSIKILFAQYNYLFIVLPFTFSFLIVSIGSFLLFAVTKNNNTDLYLNILPHGKRKIFFNKQIVIFTSSLFSLIGVLIMALEFTFFGLQIDLVFKWLFSELLWVLLFSIIWTMFFTSLMVFFKNAISAISCLFFASSSILALQLSPLLISSDSTSLKNRVYKMLRFDENLNIIEVNRIAFNDGHDSMPSSWTGYLPQLGMTGMTELWSNPSSVLEVEDLIQIAKDPKMSTLLLGEDVDKSKILQLSDRTLILEGDEISIFEYGNNLDKMSEIIHEDFTSSNAISALLSNSAYWDQLFNTISKTKNLPSVNLSNVDVDVLKTLIGENIPHFNQLYKYTSLFSGLEQVLHQKLLMTGLPKGLIDLATYVWTNPIIKYYVETMNYLGIKKDAIPSIMVKDRLKRALDVDINYIKDVMFHASFDQVGQIQNVQSLSLSGVYQDVPDWNKNLSPNKVIKDKKDWDELFFVENNVISNLENILNKVRVLQNNDFPVMDFHKNVNNSFSIDGVVSLNSKDRQTYFSLLYICVFASSAFVVNRFAKAKLSRKDIL